MVSAVTEGIKSLLSVTIKPRQDGYTDQFIRVVMMKLMMAATFIIGLNWYTDNIICIIPSSINIDKDFVSSACWINGLYVYEDILNHTNGLGYYGIPNDISIDGIFPNNEVCSVKLSYQKCAPEVTFAHRHPIPNCEPITCKPMEKKFYLQYQYMVFYALCLSALYYAPYVLFRKVNEDVVALKGSMKKGDSAVSLVDTYFNHRINSRLRMRVRIIGEIFIKFLYVCVTVTAFVNTDYILNGDFMGYGSSWASWSKLNNSMAYDYMGKRSYPKPGNQLLPSYGLCEVREASQDFRTRVTNINKFVCEMSQHIIYQYIFILLWFAMVFSIIVSVIGLFSVLLTHITNVIGFMSGSPYARTIFSKLSLRECQYLEIIRRKDIKLYGLVTQRLKKISKESCLVNKEADDDTYMTVTKSKKYNEEWMSLNRKQNDILIKNLESTTTKNAYTMPSPSVKREHIPQRRLFEQLNR